MGDVIKFIQEGYSNFSADDKGNNPKNDGSATCDVSLALHNNGKQVYNCIGKTGSGFGHAEMHGLHLCILNQKAAGLSIATIAKNFNSGAFEVDLTCEEKSCCVQCSVILGIFKVKAFDFDTTKCKKTMLGGGAWGMSADLKSTLKAITEIQGNKLSNEDINGFSTSFTQYYKHVL